MVIMKTETLPKIRSLAALVLLFSCAVAPAKDSPASAGFEKLKSLAGDWVGQDAEGHPAKTSFRLAAANTAVMETLAASDMEEMVTIYSMDGDGIALIHFCPTNNQPHMRAVPASGKITELSFEFQGAGNLPSIAVGHEHKLVMRFDGSDRLTETWTWRKNGKDTDFVYHFTRKK